jgi:hypothetical protein
VARIVAGLIPARRAASTDPAQGVEGRVELSRIENTSIKVRLHEHSQKAIRTWAPSNQADAKRQPGPRAAPVRAAGSRWATAGWRMPVVHLEGGDGRRRGRRIVPAAPVAQGRAIASSSVRLAPDEGTASIPSIASPIRPQAVATTDKGGRKGRGIRSSHLRNIRSMSSGPSESQMCCSFWGSAQGRNPLSKAS